VAKNELREPAVLARVHLYWNAAAVVPDCHAAVLIHISLGSVTCCSTNQTKLIKLNKLNLTH
jgi:hypothetical protein